MSDELVSALLQDIDVRVVVATTAGTTAKVRETLNLSRAAAALLSQALTAAALMGALQKSDARINLQLECDGPLRGLFTDSDSQGNVRGYVKNPLADTVGAEGPFRWRAALGNKGFMSVLRDIGEGEHYRSSVELTHFDLAKDLEGYFAISDQVKTHVRLAQLALGENALALTGGVLVQPLPNGDLEAWAKLGEQLTPEAVQTALLASKGNATALVKELFPRADLEVMSRFPVSFSCSCSRDRVLNALAAMGKAELEDLLAKEGQAEATCQFCTTRYVIPGDEIRQLIANSGR